jgi:hypothetical protein
MPEKRREKRHHKRLRIRYGVDAPTWTGFIEDISGKGFFIKTAIVQHPNTHLKIELAVSENEIIRLEGEVMWAKKVPPRMLRRIKGGMGIRISRFLSGEETYRNMCETLKERGAKLPLRYPEGS